MARSATLCAFIALTPLSAYAQQQSSDGASCSASKEAFKAAILAATNESRSQARRCGSESFSRTSALTWNNKLTAAARSHSQDMAQNNFFSHTGSDGLKSWDRARSQGYQYRMIGENIAAGYTAVEDVQQGWVSSPGHCGNIMDPAFSEMGAACVSDSSSQYRHYWTVVFGTQR